MSVLCVVPFVYWFILMCIFKGSEMTQKRCLCHYCCCRSKWLLLAVLMSLEFWGLKVFTLLVWFKKNQTTVISDPPPKKTFLSTTVPKDFHFSTDTRVKSSTSCNTEKEVDFVSQLRKPSSPVSDTSCFIASSLQPTIKFIFVNSS